MVYNTILSFVSGLGDWQILRGSLRVSTLTTAHTISSSPTTCIICLITGRIAAISRIRVSWRRVTSRCLIMQAVPSIWGTASRACGLRIEHCLIYSRLRSLAVVYLYPRIDEWLQTAHPKNCTTIPWQPSPWCPLTKLHGTCSLVAHHMFSIRPYCCFFCQHISFWRQSPRDLLFLLVFCFR